MRWTRQRAVFSCVAGVIAACTACGMSTSQGTYRAPSSRPSTSTPATTSDTAPVTTTPGAPSPTGSATRPPTATHPPPSRTRPPSTPTRPPPPPTTARRIVAYYGAGSLLPALGVLGHDSPEVAWTRLRRQAAEYATPTDPVQPAFELITSIANGTPGPDGMFRTRQPAAVIDRYLHTVRRHHGMLILDIQPGRANFLPEARALTRWLAQPDVGLALDPEWRMAPGQVPGKQIGSVSATEVNAVSGWLNGLVAAHHLPPKLFLLHKFRFTMVRNESALVDRTHLHEVVNMDGYGSQGAKLPEYRQFAASTKFDMGIKLFYKQDIDLMTPKQVLGLKPSPAVIDYQ